MATVRSKQQARREFGAFDLLEQAFHALRVTSIFNLMLYYLGAIPFVSALFYFWADMSRSSFALQEAGLASLVLGLAYFWMKIWQAVFCQRMWQQLNAGGELAKKTKMQSIRYLAAQVLIQASSFPVHVLAFICMVPLAWVYAFYQNVSALGLTQDYGNRPLRHLVADAASQAHREWGVNHMLLAILVVFSLFVWMSVVMAAVYLPILAKMFLGVESVFTMNPVATMMNSTFIFGTVLVVFLCISPLTKMLYLIRCFYGQSRTSGADLLSRLAVLKSEQQGEGTGSRRRESRLGKLTVLFVFLLLSSNAYSQSDSSVTAEAEVITLESVKDFDLAVKETLQEKHFQWRLPRGLMDEETEGGTQGFVRDLLKSLVSSVKEASRWAEGVLKQLFGGEQKKRDAAEFKGFGDIGKMASVVMVVLLVFLILLVVKIIITRRKNLGLVVAEVEVTAAVDLENEAIIASELPEDEWMIMAREKIKKGEYRLAVRALFLATLAHLGDCSLLKIARCKSNRDYQSELSLKARGLPVVIDAFGENVSLFEWGWYGLHDIDDEAVQFFTDNYEKIITATARDERVERGLDAG